MEVEQRQFYKQQINKFKELRPLYKKYCEIVEQILSNLIKGRSSEYIIQSRVKKISSFANKLFDPDKKYGNPFQEINDLCGIRIVLPNVNEMNVVCDIIKDTFFIEDVEEPEDFIKQTDSTPFLDHAQTYIVQLIPNLSIYKRLELNIPNEIMDFKAEIQVRIFISQGWAVNQYEIFNQYEFQIPRPYQQELNRVKSLLAIEDNVLNDLMEKMLDYESSYAAYMTPEKIRTEIERLMMVYDVDKENYKIGYRIAKLATTNNDMDTSIAILSEIIKSDRYKKASDWEMALILRDLGISHHIKYKKNPHSSEFLQGQAYLKEAVQRNPFDSDSWASLGGTFKEQKNYNKAFECYNQALKVNPGDPYPLGNYLVLIIQQTGDLSHIEKYREMIHKGIQRRLKQIKVMVEIPWAFFDVALFNLFLGNVNEALEYYLKGIRFSPDIWMIETTLNTINNLKVIETKLEGFNLVKQILLLGILFHPDIEAKTEKIINDATIELDSEMEQKELNFGESIVIITGGTDERIERNIQFFKNNLIESFEDFKCTIISGGTKSGICRFVGDIQEMYPQNIRTIGYCPSHMPAHVEIDKRYSTIHMTEGDDFSLIETIQYWFDILKSGIDPSKIKLIGINGGQIASFEFHAAIVFGAQVGIMKNSGRAAAELVNDPDWEEPMGKDQDFTTKKLFKILKNTSEDINNFLTRPFIIDPDIENIQKIMVQHRDSGIDMYVLNFELETVDITLFSGFLTALDNIAKEALQVGEILSIKFIDGYLAGGFFNDGEFKIVFLLNETPSKSLEDKIIKYVKEVEVNFGEEFTKLRKACRNFPGGKEMNRVLAKIFGSEILKLIDFTSKGKAESVECD